MSKFICVGCTITEVDDLFTLCDSCLEKKKAYREKEIIADAYKLIRRMYEQATDGIYQSGKHLVWDLLFNDSGKKNIEAFNVACKLATETLEFTKAEFEKSIGALIMDGVFESENDSGVDMLKLYIRDYDKQIQYITKTYLS